MKAITKHTIDTGVELPLLVHLGDRLLAIHIFISDDKATLNILTPLLFMNKFEPKTILEWFSEMGISVRFSKESLQNAILQLKRQVAMGFV